MTPINALKVWASLCDPAGVQWSLYKETLLCANGYHYLPETLSCAQIVVRGKDLPDLVDYIFPRLPSDWTLNKEHFVNNKKQLVFYEAATTKPVLEINVLYAIGNEDQVEQAVAFRDQKTKRTFNKIKRLRRVHLVARMLCFVGILRKIYNNTFGRIVDRRIRKVAAKAFPAVVELAGTSNETLPFYCDFFTNTDPVCFRKKLFSKTVLLECLSQPPVEEASADHNADAVAPVVYTLPVFAGYQKYLEIVFGDYKNGLFDEFGCGLTAEDKVELKKHQARCFEALTFLQTLSQEFGLRYYLLAGSVLGAIRHNGFIPWDDDIDVGIRVEELKKFEKVVKANMSRLPKGFTLEQSGPKNPYPRMFSKICYEGRCCIDLWPLVPTYREGMKAKFQWYFGKLITKVHYHKIGHEVNRFHQIAAFVGFFLSDKAVMAMARRNERKYAKKKTPAYVNLYSIYKRPKETIKRVWLDESATAIFHGLEVPVVGHTKIYLTHLYGNYMAFPLPWKRASRHYARFGAYALNNTTKKK